MRFFVVRRLLILTSLLLCGGPAALAGQEVLDAYFRPDVAFPQYAYFWNDSSPAEWEMYGDAVTQQILGGNLQVYIRNTGSQPLKIEDVMLEGISLKRAIAFSDQRKFKKSAYAANIYFSDLAQSELETLIAAGEPVWWKVEPELVRPGEAAQVVIRLRRAPKTAAVKVEPKVINGSSQAIRIPTARTAPEIRGMSFAPGLDKVYIYVRHPKPGNAPVRILMDGQDITALSTIGKDAAMSPVPVICKLKESLPRSSFHCFQVVYDDGSKATAGIRAYDDELGYALWGARPGKESELEIGREHVMDMALHNINVQQEVIGSAAVRAFMNSDEGRSLMKRLGIRKIVGEPDKIDPTQRTFLFYLADEPDTADFKVKGVPANSKVGCLAQGLLQKAEELRGIDPDVPNMLNVDMTFKPENWYTYGQLPDVYAADPYYQTRLAQAYRDKPGTIYKYNKATFVYAVGSICESACAPNPLHLILNCARVTREGWRFRFATPEEKRIEVYYSLAAGAKGFSYWWFIPLGPKATGADGCGADDPDARKLWREIGLLGAEVRTAGPLIVTSCPAPIPVEAPRELWVRTLLRGTDTAIILCVNDDYGSDRVGTVIAPVENAEVSVALPAWLDVKDVFELDFTGTKDVDWDKRPSDVKLRLGRVNVTRMIFATSDPDLRSRLQKLYDAKFAANVAGLTAEADK